MFNAIISTQVRDENQYLDEWVQYNLALGFDHIVIYDNESIIPVVNEWGKRVTVLREHRPFEGSVEDNCHNDTIRNFKAEWVARIDVDEFIVLKHHTHIGDLLENYTDYGGLGINWRIFGTSGHVTEPAGLVRDNYVWRMPDKCGWILNGGSFHLKTIIHRKYCEQVHHPHFCISSRPLVNEDFVPYPDAWTDSSRQLAVINHYVTKSLETWNKKYELWRHRFGLRTLNELRDIDTNCIVFDDTLKSNDMINEKTFQWATHQPLIQGVLKLYDPEFVLELGIGENSTPLFRTRKRYMGIENNAEWIAWAKAAYPKMTFIHHDLDKQYEPLETYYRNIQLPECSSRMLFVDNYESCRLIAINTLRDKFDLIMFHDCEPEPGARINHYYMVNSDGFHVYFLKTSANWTALMVRNDVGFGELLNAVNPFIDKFRKTHPEMEWMRLSNKYDE